MMDELLQPTERHSLSSRALPNKRKSLNSGSAASPEDTNNHTALSQLYSQRSSPAYHVGHAEHSASAGKHSY